MKRYGILTSVIALTITLTFFQPVVINSQRTGSITGVVIEKDQDDGDKTVNVTVKSDIPFDSIVLVFPGNIGTILQEIKLPDGSIIQIGSNGALNITGFTPTTNYLGGFEIPKADLTSTVINGLKGGGVKIDCSLGDYQVGSTTVNIQPGTPIKPVKPTDAATIPTTIRPGSPFIITPKDEYSDGNWSVYFEGQIYDGSDEDDFFSGDPTRTRLPGDKPSTTNGAKPPNTAVVFYIPESAVLPPNVDEFKVGITYDNAFGETLVIGDSNTTIQPPLPPTNGGGNVLPPPTLINCNPMVFKGDNVCVCGLFQTLGIQTQGLLLDGNPVAPIASSSDVVTLSTQNLTPGRHTVTWNETYINSKDYGYRAKPVKKTVEFVVLEVRGSIDQNKLFTGQGTTMRIDIIGSEEKLPIQLVNATPDVIDLQGGLKQIATTAGGKSKNGFERKVKGIKRGNFDIQYTLTLPPCPCNPNETVKAAQVNVATLPPEQLPSQQEQQPPSDQEQADNNNEKREDCGKSRIKCVSLTESVTKLINEQESQFKVCENALNFLPPEENKEKWLENCKETARKRYEPKLKIELTAFRECLAEYDDCREKNPEPVKPEVAGGQQVIENPPNFADLNSLFRDDTDCDLINRECREIEIEIREAEKKLIRELARCDRSFSERKKAENCRAEEKKAYDLKMLVDKARLTECKARKEKCKLEEE